MVYYTVVQSTVEPFMGSSVHCALIEFQPYPLGPIHPTVPPNVM